MKKKEIKKILVPIDLTATSQIAINEAVTLARLLRADLYFIHVIEYSGYQFSVVPEMQVILPSFAKLEKVIEKKVAQMTEDIRSKFGIKPVVYITSGQVHSEVIAYSKKNKIDLIVMGTHGASGFKEIFIGSNSQRVVTLSDIPVLTLQVKKSKTGFKNILIPIDNSLHSREKVNAAMIFADLFGAKIHLVGLTDSTKQADLDILRAKLESVEKIVRADNHAYKTSVVKGKSFTKASMKYATQNKCDLIVINTGHESHTTGFFLGAFAQQIVNHSKIPVLSCKHTEGHYDITTPGFGI